MNTVPLGRSAIPTPVSPKPNRAVIYTRVSTDEQAEHGYSLQSQVDACRKYAEQHGFHVVAEFQDDFSGAYLDRPQFSRLRELVRARAVDVLIVYCADRLSRNLAHSLILRDEFEKAKVERHFCLRGKSDNTPEHRMLENIEGVFAEYEREKIRERMSRGKWQKATNGRFVGNGKVPYGYRRIKDELHIHEPEAAVVRRIFHEYVHGDANGASVGLRTLARRFSEEGIPTPSESAGTKHVRKRTLWAAFSIHWMMRNEIYKGLYRYGKQIGAGGVGGTRDAKDCPVVRVPAIVEESVWQQAQDRLAPKKLDSLRNRTHDYLLRGMVLCAKCGYVMHASSRKDWRNPETMRKYYRCGHSFQHHKGLEPVCPAGYVSGDWLESITWNYAVEIISSENFEQVLDAALAEEASSLQPKREELERTERLIQECQVEARNFALTLAKNQDSELIKQALKAEIAMLEKRHASLTSARDDMQAAIADATTSESAIAAAMQYRKDVSAGFEHATHEDKVRVLQLLGAQVQVADGVATVSLRLPKVKVAIVSKTSPPPSPPCTQTPRW